jgi:hypothetical protein
MDPFGNQSKKPTTPNPSLTKAGNQVTLSEIFIAGFLKLVIKGNKHLPFFTRPRIGGKIFNVKNYGRYYFRYYY